jgi:hypothetical protein
VVAAIDESDCLALPVKANKSTYSLEVPLPCRASAACSQASCQNAQTQTCAAQNLSSMFSHVQLCFWPRARHKGSGSSRNLPPCVHVYGAAQARFVRCMQHQRGTLSSLSWQPALPPSFCQTWLPLRASACVRPSRSETAQRRSQPRRKAFRSENAMNKIRYKEQLWSLT